MGESVVSSNRSAHLQSVIFEGRNWRLFRAYAVPFLPLSVDLIIEMDVILVYGLLISVVLAKAFWE